MTATPEDSTGTGWSWLRPLGRWTVGKVLLALLFWPLTVTYYLMAPGVRLANPVFRPQPSRVHSGRTIQRLQTARTIAGLAVVTVLYILYTAEGVDAMFNDLLMKTLWAMAVGVVALTAGIALVYSLAAADGRRQVRSRLRYPVRTVAMTAGTGVALWAVTWLSTQHLPAAVNFLVLAWGVVHIGFTLRTMFLVTKHVFSSADVHPLLPSLLTPVIAGALTAIELIGNPSLPTDVQLTVTLAGASTVSALAIAEWIALRNRNPGLSLRDGLWENPPDTTTA